MLFISQSFHRRNWGRASCRCDTCYLSTLADKLNLSHVAVKKHVDLLIDEKYVGILNPGGKPAFLALSDSGKQVLREISSK